MNDKQLFLDSIDFATSIVELVGPGDMQNPTPDTEWTVRQLLDHTLYELCWVSDIVAGKTIEEVDGKYDGDLIGSDLQTAWHSAYEDATESVEAASATHVHLSYGDVPLSKYLRQAAADQLIHAWDLGQGIGVTVEFPEELAETVYDHSEPAELAASGMFAQPIEVPADAPVQAKLLALYGRTDQAE